MVFDLHSHSTCSDGLLSPAQLTERAVLKGVTALALTDHDDVSGLEEAKHAADEWGIEIIPGVEISVLWQGTTLHIVGLHIDPEHQPLAVGLADIRAGREQRARKMADSLAAAGIEGSLEGARRYAQNPELVSRSHFARFLVAQGVSRDTNSVFRDYLTPGKPGFVPHQWALLTDALDWIRGSGGIAVLAHPGRYRINEAQRGQLLREFRDSGGAAVEVVTGSHAPDEYVTWARYAKEFGLLASVGSDFHGPGESYRDLGEIPALPAGCEPVWSLF